MDGDHRPGACAELTCRPRITRRPLPSPSPDALPKIIGATGRLPLTYAYGGVRAFGYLAGAGGLAVVLVYFSVNIAVIRAFRTEFRDQFRLGRHLLIPATASVIFLFPLWGIVHPSAYTLVNLLPFAALGWLCLGVIAAGVLRARRPPASRDGAQSSCQRTGNQQERLASAGARQRALAAGRARQPKSAQVGSIFLRRRAG